MLPTALEAVRAVLKAGPTVSPGQRTQILTVVRQGDQPPPPAASTPEPSQVLTRAEVARRFSRSIRFVDYLAKQGVLRRITMPGRSRAVGFLAQEVDAVMRSEASQPAGLAQAAPG